MDFSESYLNERFEAAYRSGVEAKERGDLSAAREHFLRAASLLRELAAAGEEGRRAERENTAARIERIARAMAQSGSAAPAKRRVSAAPASADELPAGLSFYPADELTEGFDGVVGLTEAKEQIKKYAINPRLYPQSYNYSFLSNMGILLVGPPGTGKTTFAKAVSYEVRQPFACINSSALVNCYIGETAKNIDKLFAFLRDYAEKNSCGVTIFFDEFDEIAKRRGSDDKVSEAAVPALLRNLDGMMKNENFLILANSNLPKESFDPGIWERFRQRIYIPLPDASARRKLFELKLRDVEPAFLEKVDFDRAAALTEDMSGRDITFICDDFKYKLSEIKAGLSGEEDVGAVLEKIIRTRGGDE